MHADFHAEAEVESPGLDAECICGAFDQAVQFGFSGTEGNRALCKRPVLYQVGAAKGDST